MAAACLLMAAAAAAAVATPVTDASKACLAPSLMGVPMPFAERESRAFVDAPIMTKLPQTGAKAETAVVPRAIMAELYAARKEQLCARLRENATLVRLMLEATADGFVAGALGLDARVPFARRRQSNSSSSEDVLGWAPLRALRDAYYDDPDWSSVTNLSAPARAFASWPVATLGASTHQLSEAFWALDTEARTTAERAVRAQLGGGPRQRDDPDGTSTTDRQPVLRSMPSSMSTMRAAAPASDVDRSALRVGLCCAAARGGRHRGRKAHTRPPARGVSDKPAGLAANVASPR